MALLLAKLLLTYEVGVNIPLREGFVKRIFQKNRKNLKPGENGEKTDPARNRVSVHSILSSKGDLHDDCKK